jgi:hypothetical protein
VSLKRKIAVQEGRAMVRVRRRADGQPDTAGVCPACWNIPERREVLLLRLEKMGMEVAFRDDRLDGVYRVGKEHAPGCPYGRLPADPWTRFRRALDRP